MSSNKFVSDLIAAEFIDSHEPKHQNGPDYRIQTDKICTWIPDGAVKILNESETTSATSVVTMFNKAAENYSDRTALIGKKDSNDVKWTYKQYFNDVRTVAKGFIKLGLVPFHGVCILGFNSPEWFISHLGAIFAGGFPAGIYTTNSPLACFHVLNDCDANIVVVENEKQLEKILEIRENLPQLKTIIQYNGTPTHPDVLSWNDLLLIGQSVNDDILEKRIKGLAVNQCCFLIYTSGTTGNSKGVMLSHDNMYTFSTINVQYILGTEDTTTHHKILSYLPLSHVLALAADLYAAMHLGATVYFATPDVLKGKMVDMLQEVKPTVFLTVPRIIEKMFEKVQSSERSMNWVTAKLIKWAKEQSLYYHLQHKQRSASKPITYSLAKSLVLNKIKATLGLQQAAEYFYCAGAPLAEEIKKYFLSLDFEILDGFGLSETIGAIIRTERNSTNLSSLGNVNSMKYELKILNADNNGNGEVLIRGRTIFMGYLKLEEETRKTIDNDRWLHTGDLGKIDNDGCLYITGRIKELVITAGGENIPPLLIEEAIKTNLPVVSNCVLIGDKRKYLSLLITLKTEFDEKTFLPIDKLTQEAISWCESVGSKVKTLTEIINTNDSKVMDAIQAGITKYNEVEATSNAQKIQKWVVLPQDFSVGNGELGPTGKMRRPYINEKYSEMIEKMY